eukprot:TRINITY_DN50600_c0_g1_i1.p1 TRINITY_DN50600_c0_g1~~TRINITY_DN50600_c0_g1_i1.p1  ORF type:complete len:537 (+),score=86.69 TRINITY_DN50600_c0_g1_i1:98-1708(+)
MLAAVKKPSSRASFLRDRSLLPAPAVADDGFDPGLQTLDIRSPLPSCATPHYANRGHNDNNSLRDVEDAAMWYEPPVAAEVDEAAGTHRRLPAPALRHLRRPSITNDSNQRHQSPSPRKTGGCLMNTQVGSGGERVEFADLDSLHGTASARKLRVLEGLLGQKEPLSTLADEFKFNSSFAEKVDRLAREDYVGWRRVRGDGNCFYRAVGFAILEHLAFKAEERTSPGGWAEEFLQQILTLRDLVDADPDHSSAFSACAGSGTTNAYETLVEDIVRLREGEKLYWEDLQDKALIRALRLLTARCLADNKDNEQATESGISFETICLAEGYRSTQAFCEQVVLPMGVEAEGVVLPAMAMALDISLRVAVLDRSDTTTVAFADYKARSALRSARSVAPLVHLQLRPGHYDLLYHSWIRSAADMDDLPRLLSSGSGAKLSRGSGSGTGKSLGSVPDERATLQSLKGFASKPRSMAPSYTELPPEESQETEAASPPTFGKDDLSAWMLATAHEGVQWRGGSCSAEHPFRSSPRTSKRNSKV